MSSIYGPGSVAGSPFFQATVATPQATWGGNTATKIAFDSILFDAGAYWSAANKRWVPGAAGKYLVALRLALTGTMNNAVAGGVTYEAYARITKNGAAIVGGSPRHQYDNRSLTSVPLGAWSAAGIVDLNGTTDYLEAEFVLGTNTSGNFSSVTTIAGVANCAFEAFRVQ